jgi:predicted ATPase
MNNFRLIAITPLLGCDSIFSKNLVPGTTYQFYHQYEIIADPFTKHIAKVARKSNYPAIEDFYTLKNGIAVDFSAVAGKNGTGKSTLFELLYYAIYLIASRNLANGAPPFHTVVQDLKYERDRMQQEHLNLSFATGLGTPNYSNIQPEAVDDIALYTLKLIQHYKLHVNAFRVDSFQGIPKIVAASLQSKISDIEQEIENETRREALLDTSFNVSFVYEADGDLRELHCFDGGIAHYSYKNGSDKTLFESFSLERFFYSISLNFSHHSLNSRTVGKWITKLFHKNDAYITPVVINPMRTEGNFNINDELQLSRERLSSTLAYGLLQGHTHSLLEKYKVSKFVFTPKLGPAFFGSEESIRPLLKHFTGLDVVKEDIPYGDVAFAYLLKKIGKIGENYDFLLQGVNGEKKSVDQYVIEDDSHISRKIRQTFNFLKVSSESAHKKIWGKNGGMGQIALSPEDYEEYLRLFGDALINASPDEISKFALPGFFTIDFEFEDLQGNKILLSGLSSGEQQAIFNINAILYHLYNLQSVHPTITPAKINAGEIMRKRLAYNHVNIILDEMELYYHPEMQRALVKNLVDSFEWLKADGIKAINVCILTHSPFVLSDIPASRVLLLERDDKGQSLVRENKSESFAANINDLLADNFFLEETLIGDYATEKIDALIDRINDNKPLAGDDALIESIGDPYLKASLRNSGEDYE